MLDELNRRLSGIRERVAYKRKLEASGEDARRSLAYHRERLPRLVESMEQTRRDVARLEGAGPRAIIASLLGSKEETLERERHEYLAASLQHHECAHAIASCEADIGEIETSLATLGDVDATYEAALEEKARVLASGTDARAFRLMRIAEDVGVLTFQAREAREAVTAGETALEALESVSTALADLFGVGVDVIDGVGVARSQLSPTRLNVLVDATDEAQDRLRVFRRELADLGIKAKLELDLDSELDELTSSSRSLFGGYYSRSKARAEIDAAGEEVDSMAAKVERILDDVRAGIETVDKGLVDLTAERRRILEEV